MSMRTFKGFSTVDRTWGNFKTYDIDLAKRDLLNELYTRKGERLMSPEFGYIVWDVLFDPMTEDIVEIIRRDTERIIAKDPRLELREIDIRENFDQQSITVALVLNYVPTATLTDLLAVFYRDLNSQRTQG
jgi:phage baseplate assembly protein W